MALSDPKKYAVTKDDEEESGESLQNQIAALQAQVQALLAAKSENLPEDRLEKILMRVAQMSADAQERAANPSNKTHPGISVFSRPEGDRADRRDDLKCPMFWLGYPVDWDTTTDEEINLLNLSEPGLYTFKRTDRRTLEKLTIEGERDAAGKISRLLFSFPIKENRDTLPDMPTMLRDAFNVKTPQEQELETLRAQVAAMKSGVLASV